MDRKYEWPYYGIDIPPGLLKSETKTYNIFKPPCIDLENCISNTHFTVPKKRCSLQKGIILPHYTTFNKQTRQAERTYYFPENIDDPKICDNMINYTSKLESADKICDKQNNSCYIKISREFPDVFTQIFEIINELEQILDYLKEYCQSPDKQRNEVLERRINNIILSYDHSRQNMLYNASDNYLNAPIDSTRVYFTKLHTRLIIDSAEYRNKNEYMEYIKQLLIDKYIFLSYFIQFIIEQPVNVEKEISKIHDLVVCVSADELFVPASAKNIFSDLVQFNSDEGSPMSMLEQGISASGKAVVFEEQSLKQGKLSRVSEQPNRGQSEEQSLEKIVKERKKMIKAGVQEMLQYNINENYVLKYIHTQPIPIETIYFIKNKCDELLEMIGLFEQSLGKQEKQLIPIDNKNKIIKTRDLTDILLIYYAYPFVEIIIEPLLQLNDYQLQFLSEFFYKFESKFYNNFLQGSKKIKNKVEIFTKLYNRIKDSLFYDKICFLISFSIISAYNTKMIENITNGLPSLHEISEANIQIVRNVILIYQEIKISNQTYDLNTGILSICRDIPLNVLHHKIDNQLVKNNPYDILGLPHNSEYQIVKTKILDLLKTNPTLPNLQHAKELFKTVTKKNEFDSKIQQHNSMVMIFCKHLYYIINNIIYKILNYDNPTYGLYIFSMNEVILITEIYCNEILYPLFAQKVRFFLTIFNKLKLVNSERIEKTNQEIYAELRDYIRQPYEFSHEFNIHITLLDKCLDALITMDNMNQLNKDDPEKERLHTQFRHQYDEITSYLNANRKKIETFQ